MTDVSQVANLPEPYRPHFAPVEYQLFIHRDLWHRVAWKPHEGATYRIEGRPFYDVEYPGVCLWVMAMTVVPADQPKTPPDEDFDRLMRQARGGII